MLYRLRSQACADVILLQDTAHSLLALWHKDSTAAEGILTTDELPIAIQALEQAVAQEQATPNANDSQDDTPPRISLRQRAKPVLDILRRSLQADTPVLWRRG